MNRRQLTLSLTLALGAVFGLIACGSVEESPPEKVETVEQEICANDTHCEFYTDSSKTVLCGERDMCIACTTTQSVWGCVTQYKTCQIMAVCNMPH